MEKLGDQKANKAKESRPVSRKLQSWIDGVLADMKDPASKIFGKGKPAPYSLTNLAAEYAQLGGVFEK